MALSTGSLTSYKDSCTPNHPHPTPHTCTVDSTSVAPPYLTPLAATDSADGVSPAAAIAGHTTLHSTTMDTKHLQEIQQL